MSTEQHWYDLGRRAVACKGWRWMSGMMAIDSVTRRRGDEARVVWADVDGTVDEWHDWEAHYCSRSPPDPWPEGMTPYLSDPATVGCLLDLVRCAWDDPTIVASWNGVCWVCDNHAGGTEADALVAALEGAP